MTPHGAPFVAVENLHVTFATRRGLVEAVRGVDLSIEAGRTLGIVGESAAADREGVGITSALRLQQDRAVVAQTGRHVQRRVLSAQ